MKQEQGHAKAQLGHANEARPARVSPTAGNKLYVNPELLDTNYYYYFELDKDGRIEQLQAAWYEVATDQKGDPIKRPSGNGETHILMKVLKQYRDEDVKSQQDNLDRIFEDQLALKPGETTRNKNGLRAQRESH